MGAGPTRPPTVSTLRSNTSDERPLPAGKAFHYFLSHKKQHSLHGSVPEQVALNLHDSLSLLGYLLYIQLYMGSGYT